MIVVAGGTGLLGSQLTPLLTDLGLPVRLLTRDPHRAAHLAGAGVEIVGADVRDPATLRPALSGASVVVSAIQGFGGIDAGGVGAVDDAGNANLIEAAVEAGVGQFVLVSIHAAGANHPMPLFRAKYAAEQRLIGSPLEWTIIRPAAFMETWLSLLAGPASASGPVRVFGRGNNPINFVSARDVAQVVARAVNDRSLRGRAVEVEGPQNLTFNEFAHTMLGARGGTDRISHVPRPIMRAMALLLRFVRPTVAAQVAAGVVMDTYPMTGDPAAFARQWSDIRRTTLAALVRSQGRQPDTAGPGPPTSG